MPKKQSIKTVSVSRAYAKAVAQGIKAKREYKASQEKKAKK